jgi:hypothetical protein
MRAAILAATLVAAGAGTFSGIATADPTTPEPPTPAAPAPDPNAGAEPPPAAPAGAPPGSIDHDGTFVVGKDIAPGTYASAGPVGNGTCYWKRIGDDQTNPIIDNAMTKKPQTVAIQPTDKAFKTSGCQAWTPTDAPADAQPTGGLPALIAGAQLRGWLSTVNNGARQYDGSQVPTP